MVGGWEHGRGSDEQVGADYIAELSIPKGIRSVDAMAEMSRLGPIILPSLVKPKGIRSVDAMAMRLHSSVGPCPEHVRN